METANGRAMPQPNSIGRAEGCIRGNAMTGTVVWEDRDVLGRDEEGAGLGAFDFFGEPSAFRSFARVSSNSEAYELAVRFAKGTIAFGGIIGPTGWGKSLLLEAAAETLRSVHGFRQVRVLSATEWVSSRRPYPADLPLIVDNAQDVLSRSRCRLQLQLAIERRVKARRPTLLAFTAPCETGPIRAAMSMRREWLTSILDAPSTADRAEILSQMAAKEGLELSYSLANIMASWLSGNGHTLAGALKRLKLHGNSWLDSQSTLRACGVLNPFLVANSRWDLRDTTLETARSVWTETQDGLSAEDLAVYGMLRLAQLSEADTSLYMKLEPGQVYQRAVAVEEHLLRRTDGTDLAHDFAERVVQAL